VVPKYFRDNLHLNESYIGLILAINGLIIVAFEMVLIFHLEKKNKNMHYIIWGLFICAMAFVSLLIPGPAKIISLMMILLITVGEIITMPFMNSYWTARSNDKNRGQYAALYTMAWGTAQTLGPFLSSALVDASSFDLLFVVMAILLIFCAIGFIILKNLKPSTSFVSA
jgi:predicted MFS family arabinose efflux permease